MKKTLLILIAAAMLVSSAAYAAPNDGHGENGRETPVRTEQKADRADAKPEAKPETKNDKADAKPETKTEKSDAKPENPDVKPEIKPSDESDNSETNDTEKTDNETSEKTDSDSENTKDTDTVDTEKQEIPERPDKKFSEPKKEAMSNEEFRKELDEIKKIRRENKEEASEIINDLRDIFHETPKEDRKEILGEIAEIKKELKDDSIGMFMRGKHVDFDKYDGVKPEIVKERTLVPLRAVSETLGAEVEWNDENKTVTVTYNDITIIVTIDSTTALVNGEEVEIDSPAIIKKDRVLVPIRIIAETLGLTVEWDDDSHSVIVDEKEPSETDEKTETTEPSETDEQTETTDSTKTDAE